MNLVRLRRCGNIRCSSHEKSIDIRTASSRSVYQVNAKTLCELVKRIEIKRVTKSFGQLLCLASIYPSDNDNQLCPIKSCGHPERSVNVLTNLPDLISIAIDWHSFQCSTTDVEDLLSKMDPLIHLRELFYDVTMDDARHQQLHLIGLVCFYSGTIEVFFSYDQKSCKWHFCFDGNVLVSADWNAVMRKCMEFHLQPFLLIYANPSRNSVDISQLLKQTVIQAKQTPQVQPKRSDLMTNTISNNTSKTTSLTRTAEYQHSIENLEKISSFAQLNSSMLFLPKSSYINEETVAKVMHQQIAKKETLSDTTSMSSSNNSSPLVNIRNRSYLMSNCQQILEDGSSSVDSSASSQRDSGLGSGMNDESSDTSPRDSLVEHELSPVESLIKQTQSLKVDDQVEKSYALIEEELENSLKFESASDFRSALSCCERAIVLVDAVLNQNGDHGSSIYARTKKNSLFLRIRSLKKRQVEQEESLRRSNRTSFVSTFKPPESREKQSDTVYDNNLSRGPSSILSSTRKIVRPKKNVKFSDHVALIVPTTEDNEEGSSEHLIHSFLRKIHQQSNCSDSDSDSASNGNELPDGLTECSLCQKRCSKTLLIGTFCSNCHFYMQRFQPTES